EGLPPGPPIPP
nr:bradykinin potentiating peptide C [Gloydius blomhoffii]